MASIRMFTAAVLLCNAALVQPALAQPNDAPMNIPGQGLRVRPTPPPDRAEMREREAMREINGRIHLASDHIERAARRGRLSPHESRRLRREVQDIREMEARMNRDRHIDRREREALHRRLESLERHIRQEIRD